MRNIDKVMKISEEVPVGCSQKMDEKQNDKDKQNEKIRQQLEQNTKEKFKNWIFGVGISLIALLPVPFYLLAANNSIKEVLFVFVCDASLIFIAISSTITSLNDFIDQKIEPNNLFNTEMGLIVAGAIIYAAIKIAEQTTENLNKGAICILNLLYFIIMFIFSFKKYKDRIEEYNEKNSIMGKEV